jgi:hypothetical protein
MKKFAVLEDNKIINIIIADSKENAENLTGKICIEFTDEPAEPNGTYENGRFLRAKPYPSWILDEEDNWQSPIPHPIQEDKENPKHYNWNEETTSWIEVIN